MLKVRTLFSGIGAAEAALRDLGIEHEIVDFCEIDKYAVKSYCAIHGIDESKNLGDISKVWGRNLPYADLLVWGFPCQDISNAGKMAGIKEGETRSGLYYEGFRILKETMPKYSIIENVKNLVGKKFKADFESMLYDIESIGYNNYWKVLNAKNYGIPQNRERVFIVSIRKDVDTGGFEFPEAYELKKRLKDLLEDEVDEKYYLSDERIGMIINWKAQQRPLTRILGRDSISPTLTARGAGEYHSGMLLYSNDYEDVTNYELQVKEATKNYHGNIRYFTEKECFRLMGFSDEDFYKAQQAGVSNSQLYKQAGNSIVTNVLYYIFKNLPVSQSVAKRNYLDEVSGI